MTHKTLDPKYGDIIGFTRGGHRTSIPATPVMYVREGHYQQHWVVSLQSGAAPGARLGELIFAAGLIELSSLPESRP